MVVGLKPATGGSDRSAVVMNCKQTEGVCFSFETRRPFETVRAKKVISAIKRISFKKSVLDEK
jgi:hypothetical protein